MRTMHEGNDFVGELEYGERDYDYESCFTAGFRANRSWEVKRNSWETEPQRLLPVGPLGTGHNGFTPLPSPRACGGAQNAGTSIHIGNNHTSNNTTGMDFCGNNSSKSDDGMTDESTRDEASVVSNLSDASLGGGCGAGADSNVGCAQNLQSTNITFTNFNPFPNSTGKFFGQGAANNSNITPNVFSHVSPGQRKRSWGVLDANSGIQTGNNQDGSTAATFNSSLFDNGLINGERACKFPKYDADVNMC